MKILLKTLFISLFALVITGTSAFANNNNENKNEINNKKTIEQKNEDKKVDDTDENKDSNMKEKNDEKKETKLPQEVLDLYKMIETKYGSEKIIVDYKGKDGKNVKLGIPNGTIYFGLSGMKELKDGIKNIDNNIKIDYIMSKLVNFDLGVLGNVGEGGLSDGDSLYTYTTYGYYLKSINTIKALMSLGGDQSSIQRLDEYVNKNKGLIKFLLDIGLGNSIGRNESGTSFVGKPGGNSKILNESARNGGYYQIYAWCNPIGGNAIEEGTGSRIYVSGKHIGGQATVYGGSEKYHLRAAPMDKMCSNRFGLNIDQVKMTDARFLELGKKYQQIDKERYTYIKSVMGGNEENTLIYLGKELQYMHQFHNFVAFMMNKFGHSIGSLTQYSLNGKSGGLNKNIEKYGIHITNEQYKQDLSLAHKCMFSENGCTGILFNGYNNSNKALFRKIGVQDENGYKDLILIYSIGVIGTLYNGTKNVGNSYLDNAYVSNPGWMDSMLFGKKITVNTCRVWSDGGPIECKDGGGSIGVGMSYLFYLKYFLGKEITTSFIEHLSILQNNGQLKYLKLSGI